MHQPHLPPVTASQSSGPDAANALPPVKSPHTPTPIKSQPGHNGTPGHGPHPSSTTSPFSRHLTSPSQPRHISASPVQPHTPVSHSALNLMNPTPLSIPATMPGPIMHSGQHSGPPHPFASPLHHPHHPLLHTSIFQLSAAAAAHAMHPYYPHPHPGYSMPYPYPYGPLPQPHPIPPMHPGSSAPGRHDPVKPSTIESTMLSSHSHHSTSSSVTTRSLREISESTEDPRNPNATTERHQLHETTMTQHHSTSHHSAVHTSTEKQPNHAGGGLNHTLSISHSTSSSSSQSIQHKINTQQKTSSHSSSPHHLSASVSQSTSSSSSVNNHTHHHSHHLAHHPERLSPADSMLLRHHPKMLPGNPNHLMIQPPSMGHPMGLSLPPGPGPSSIESLRLHAQAAAGLQAGHGRSGSRTSCRTDIPIYEDRQDPYLTKPQN